MKQDCETSDVIELGCVSADTEGSTFVFEDTEAGMRFKNGLADD